MKTNLKQETPPRSGDYAFISDLTALRSRAREQMMKGAVTPSFAEEDRKAIVELLNTALATEIVCVLRYKRHYYATHGIRAKFVSAEFLEHAKEEQAHARPERRAHRHRKLPRNDHLYRSARSDLAPSSGVHPRPGGGTRRRPR